MLAAVIDLDISFSKVTLSAMPSLECSGYAIMDTSVSVADREVLREKIFCAGEAGRRCLLDVSDVRRIAMTLKADLADRGILGDEAVAVQAIAFDKTDSANWKVAWHQDLMFPFAGRVSSPAYSLACVKEGVDYARPPREVLETLLAVRLHLDDCDETNGPLRVSPGSHLSGVISSAEVAARVASHGEATCLAKEGQALLMRPLLLHASSKATVPKHRRVLHVVFHDGSRVEEPWHRSVANQALPSSARVAKWEPVMSTPPPLPPVVTTRPIQRAVFKESLSMRLGDVSFDYNLIEKSHQKAEAWINENPGIEIVQIQTFHSSLHGITVVWYR